MPIVSITITQGRTPAEKEGVYREVTDALVRVLGVKPEGVRVMLNEIPKTHFAIAGKPLAPFPPEAG